MESVINKFLSVSYGYGSGSGDGSGSGSGDGSGSGSGSGSGYGYGSGSGSGDGSGDGSGSGYGYGYGSGYGSGSGSGSGDGLKSINGKTVYIVDDTPTIIESVKANYAKGFIIQSDLTLKPCCIAKVGNYFAHGDTLSEAHADAMSKYTQNMPVEERIKLFNEQFDRSKKYPAKDFFKWHNTLTGSCEFGRRSFCQERGIDIENDELTVEEFIALTKNSYGSDIIKQIISTNI